MIESTSPEPSAIVYRPPYADLFIYYLEGHVPEKALIDEPTLIGT